MQISSVIGSNVGGFTHLSPREWAEVLGIAAGLFTAAALVVGTMWVWEWWGVEDSPGPDGWEGWEGTGTGMENRADDLEAMTPRVEVFRNPVFQPPAHAPQDAPNRPEGGK